MVDGQLAYGRIGVPHPLPLTIDVDPDCFSCEAMKGLSGFRTASGYGLSWRLITDSLGFSLNSLNVDSNFAGGQPRELLTRDTKMSLEVVPGPDGFMAVACSAGSEAEWLPLNSNLEATAGAPTIKPEAPCLSGKPTLLWTGEGYLASFVDERGLMVALLDEGGVIVRETAVLEDPSAAMVTRFSKNGDRVLLVAAYGTNEGQAKYGVFDSSGHLLGDLKALGEAESTPTQVAIATSGDGWLVATDYFIPGSFGSLLSAISRDGVLSREERALGGHPLIFALGPSAYGGFLYVGAYDSGGAYSGTYESMAIFNDVGEPVFSEEVITDDAESRRIGVIQDAQRDLVIEVSQLEGSAGDVFVQEYGCLD